MCRYVLQLADYIIHSQGHGGGGLGNIGMAGPGSSTAIFWADKSVKSCVFFTDAHLVRRSFQSIHCIAASPPPHFSFRLAGSIGYIKICFSYFSSLPIHQAARPAYIAFSSVSSRSFEVKEGEREGGDGMDYSTEYLDLTLSNSRTEHCADFQLSNCSSDSHRQPRKSFSSLLNCAYLLNLGLPGRAGPPQQQELDG